MIYQTINSCVYDIHNVYLYNNNKQKLKIMTTYTNKTIKTETKTLEILRETKVSVFVRPNDCKLWKDICISKSDLTLVNNGTELSFELPFRKVWTESNFKLNALGFEGNLNSRKNSMLTFV